MLQSEGAPLDPASAGGTEVPAQDPPAHRQPLSERDEQAYRTWLSSVRNGLPAGWATDKPAVPEHPTCLEDIARAAPDPDLALLLTMVDRTAVDEAGLLELIAVCQRLTSWLGAQQAELVAELSERLHSTPMWSYLADDLAARLSLTGYASAKLTDRADSLREFPEVHEALTAGLIDIRKADVLIDGTETLPGAQARAVHRQVLPKAGQLTAPQLRKKIATAAMAVDGDHARKRHEQAKRTREVSFRPAPDGMAWLSAYLPAQDAMVAFTALEILAGKQSAEDDRGVDARRADAFTQLFQETLDYGRTPAGCELGTRQRGRPHLMLTMSGTAPSEQQEVPGELSGYGPITTDQAKEIAGGPTQRTFVFTDPETGQVVPPPRPRSGSPPVPKDPPAAAAQDRTEGHDPPQSRRRRRRQRRDQERQSHREPSPSENSTVNPAFPPAEHPPPSPAFPPAEHPPPSPASPPAENSPAGPASPGLHQESEQPGWRLPGTGLPPSSHDAPALVEQVQRACTENPVDHLGRELGLLATDGYVPGAALREYVLQRDRTCRFPSCQMPGWRCQLDHISPFNEQLPAWAQTVDTNLHLLCTRHHRMKTIGGWQVSRDHHGTTHWLSGIGYHFTRSPEVVDPTPQLRALRSSLAGLVEELGEEIQDLRTDGTIAPGTSDIGDPVHPMFLTGNVPPAPPDQASARSPLGENLTEDEDLDDDPPF